MRFAVFVLCLLVGTAAFATPSPKHYRRVPHDDLFMLSIVGTSDLHGRIGALPTFAGYLKNLRAARARDGAVLLLDAGDMFQGTLESNLAEGAPVVEAYNDLGYAAAAIGNHEFDFGPEGPATAPTKSGDDPRGALRARAAQAKFPFLAANVVEAATGNLPAWKNVKDSHLVKLRGLTVGIVGGVTPATEKITLPANVNGLRFLPLAKTIADGARELRRKGATVIIAVVHEGGGCRDFAAFDDLSSCQTDSGIFRLARALPAGLVDAIVAGHSHQGVAKIVAGIPIIQSYANGRAFGRIDLRVERKRGNVISPVLYAPRDLCVSGANPCDPGEYEGAPVLVDETLRAKLDPAFAQARRKSLEPLGVTVLSAMPHHRSHETALGNWIVDRMLESQPGADLALMNGGALRAGFPVGELTYGRLYEAFPFDNAFASFTLAAGELGARIARTLDRGSSLMSVAGLRLSGACVEGRLRIAFRRPDGTLVPDDARLRIVTSDYLATGGDGFLDTLPATVEFGPSVRDTVAAIARRRGGAVDPTDAALVSPTHPRIDLPHPVPIRCGAQGTR